MGEITQLLDQARSGDAAARDLFFSRIYTELDRFAKQRLARQSPLTMLDAPGLVHEVYLRLSEQAQLPGADRRAFLAYAARVMRSVVIDYVRSRSAQRHGGGRETITLQTGMTALLRMQLAAGDAAAVSSARDLIAKIEASRSRADMPDEEAAAHMLLGVALMRAGDPAAARGHLERAVAMRERMDAAESLWLAQARLYLAQCLYRSADRAAARRMMDLAAAAHRQHAVLGPQHHDLLTQTRTLIAS